MRGALSPRQKHEEFYRTPLGLSRDIKDALYTSVTDIIAVATDELNRRDASNVSPGAFAGVANRETRLKYNEEDIDYNDDGTVKRRTYGVYQGDNPLSSSGVEIATTEFAGLLLNHLKSVSKYGKFDVRGPIPLDAYAYAAWMHNAGSDATKSLAKYGMDWQATIARNTAAYKASPDSSGAKYMVERMIPYGNAVLSLVSQYPTAKLVS